VVVAALNEGREMFPGDREYGEWLRSSNLEDGLHPADMSAAMWVKGNLPATEQKVASQLATPNGSVNGLLTPTWVLQSTATKTSVLGSLRTFGYPSWVTTSIANANLPSAGNPLLLAVGGVRPDQCDEHEHQCGYNCYVSHVRDIP
jgi:hypothetical protein